MLSSFFEISVVVTAVPLHYMLIAFAALWICLVIFILIDV